MLTTSRRFACVNSLFAALAPAHGTHQQTFLAGREGGVVLVDALRSDLALLDQLREAPFVLRGQQVDLADLTQVHPHSVGRAALALRCRPAGSATPTPLEEPLDGVAVPITLGRVVGLLEHRVAADRRRRLVDVLDGIVDRDPVPRHRRLDLDEDVAGQLDVAKHVGEVFGVHRAPLTTEQHQIVPLDLVDTGERNLGRAAGDVGAGVRLRRLLVVGRFSPHGCVPMCVDPANLATTRRPREPVPCRCR